MLGDLLKPWTPETAYRDWLRAGMLAAAAELVVARKTSTGRKATELEHADAKRLRTDANALRGSALLALSELRSATPL